MSSDFQMDTDFEDFDSSNLTTKNLFEGAEVLNESINTTLNNLQYNNNNGNGFGMGAIDHASQQQQYYQQMHSPQQIDYRGTPRGGSIPSQSQYLQHSNGGSPLHIPQSPSSPLMSPSSPFNGRQSSGGIPQQIPPQSPQQIPQQHYPQQPQQQQYQQQQYQQPQQQMHHQQPQQMQPHQQQMHQQPQQQQQQQAPSTAISSPQPILDTIYKLLSEQETNLVKMIHDQSILLNRITQPLDEQTIHSLQALSQQQVTLSSQMNTEMSALDATKKGMILDPTDLAKLFALRQDLQIQFKQLTLLHHEIQSVLNPTNQPTKPNIALVMKTQPFPVVITKGKQLSENQLVVQILTGARSNFHINGPVKATLMCDNHPTNKNNPQQQLEMDSQPIYPATLTAHFPLKFLAGTRKSSVNLKFGVNVRDMDSVTTAVESDSSNPFVVITNECQWEGSAGVLLKKDAFDGQLEISWAQFINTLQRHFLIATKQDQVRPKRPLSQFDFKYIQQHFFANRSIIHQQDFDRFWNWFGKSMQTLRYQRHISTLWQEGIIYGYMGRQEVNDALTNQDPGTFIIRFSERNPGQFGIAYIGMEVPHRIKHYLVQPNDTAAAKKTFPDFLAEHPQFINILQWTKGPDGLPRFLKSHKDTALGSFAPKKAQPAPIGGYEPLGN
ncbi:signal transducer and activator of transcription family protein [Heterostelium album PN500]|uniref:Signal transducer and activator of transcription n=1 Tax=Heterostelium pallidum (strain ATCC 26659 / Pp 5 / PN500) TaxID=670386 RepID=D3B897_HETP5|nr:signal transducer and activator of transcription family protein [Heterostelium album PN500]EFA82265.1 signal transducer and activator of transcription family protein [Heterostelium album PN500]|eukprot:XP_020434382.1 signal transducer and activator of transcription family protein [Heterostelium album PN500]